MKIDCEIFNLLCTMIVKYSIYYVFIPSCQLHTTLNQELLIRDHSQAQPGKDF